MTENVVGRETPKDVLFGADQAHVEAIGVAVEDPPQGPLLDQLAEFHHRRMVEEDVPDHQHGGAALGQGHQFLALPGVQRQGFLHEHVLAGLQAATHQVVMRGRRRGDGHRRQLGIGQHLLEVVGEGRRAAGELQGFIALLVGITNAAQGPQFREDADQVLSPISATDDRQGGVHRGPRFMIRRHSVLVGDTGPHKIVRYGGLLRIIAPGVSRSRHLRLPAATSLAAVPRGFTDYTDPAAFGAVAQDFSANIPCKRRATRRRREKPACATVGGRAEGAPAWPPLPSWRPLTSAARCPPYPAAACPVKGAPGWPSWGGRRYSGTISCSFWRRTSWGS